MNAPAGKAHALFMLTSAPPWKTVIIGLVAILAGVALVLVDWQVNELAKFVAMLFIALGALHIVTSPFEGIEGGVSASMAGGEMAVGIALLVWPSPTLLVLGVIVGAAVTLRGAVAGTITLATRDTHKHWKLAFGERVVEFGLGVALIARPSGTVRGTAVTLGVLMMIAGLSEVVAGVSRMREIRAARHSLRVPAVALAS
jgi:uncharacterized membrane protein HdeD (DUF308 family)